MNLDSTGENKIFQDHHSNDMKLLLDMELPIAVELGRVRLLVKDILQLDPGTVILLNKIYGEPVDLYVNNKKFAEGKIMIEDNKIGIKITALVGISDRLPDLNSA